MKTQPLVTPKEPAEVWRRRFLVAHERITQVLALHRPPRHGGQGGRHCTECGFAWPCETVLILEPPRAAA